MQEVADAVLPRPYPLPPSRIARRWTRPNGNATQAIPPADSPADSLTAHELLTILDEELSPLRRIDDFGGLEPQETRPEAIQAGQDG